uniref:Transmembrane protein n=1 Tax=Chromera velia CCMP2878 TaxID=1169474 RepID=A0A0G4F0V8_9ALVE|eukprot:Cvel_14394.t1-p1 / transcript=Cvel_14394.t1 / gene=Cvel_14394 / organism=Chromera_velia_CCMP2878 / gene_product=hypothetical protein / transcript_product=hypothetical protein / location=Cvel_scaffold1022:2886-9424(-) / protein_length=1528 / sequence_SO=supercontig / SO=protein_coding / is_pseudo=false
MVNPYRRVAAFKGAVQWTTLSWSLAFKMVLTFIYVSPMIRGGQSGLDYSDRFDSDFIYIYFAIQLTPLAYAILNFRASKQLFGKKSKTVSVGLLLHADMITFVVLDLIDIGVMFQYSLLPESALPEMKTFQRAVVSFIFLGLFFHGYSFSGLGHTPIDESSVGEVSFLGRHEAAGDVLSTRKHAAIVSIFFVDLPFLVLRIYVWVIFHVNDPGFALPMSPFVVKNAAFLVLQVFRLRLAQDAERNSYRMEQQSLEIEQNFETVLELLQPHTVAEHMPEDRDGSTKQSKGTHSYQHGTSPPTESGIPNPHSSLVLPHAGYAPSQPAPHVFGSMPTPSRYSSQFVRTHRPMASTDTGAGIMPHPHSTMTFALPPLRQQHTNATPGLRPYSQGQQQHSSTYNTGYTRQSQGASPPFVYDGGGAQQPSGVLNSAAGQGSPPAPLLPSRSRVGRRSTMPGGLSLVEAGEDLPSAPPPNSGTATIRQAPLVRTSSERSVALLYGTLPRGQRSREGGAGEGEEGSVPRERETLLHAQRGGGENEREGDEVVYAPPGWLCCCCTRRAPRQQKGVHDVWGLGGQSDSHDVLAFLLKRYVPFVDARILTSRIVSLPVFIPTGDKERWAKALVHRRDPSPVHHHLHPAAAVHQGGQSQARGSSSNTRRFSAEAAVTSSLYSHFHRGGANDREVSILSLSQGSRKRGGGRTGGGASLKVSGADSEALRRANSIPVPDPAGEGGTTAAAAGSQSGKRAMNAERGQSQGQQLKPVLVGGRLAPLESQPVGGSPPRPAVTPGGGRGSADAVALDAGGDVEKETVEREKQERERKEGADSSVSPEVKQTSGGGVEQEPPHQTLSAPGVARLGDPPNPAGGGRESDGGHVSMPSHQRAEMPPIGPLLVNLLAGIRESAGRPFPLRGFGFFMRFSKFMRSIRSVGWLGFSEYLTDELVLRKDKLVCLWLPMTMLWCGQIAVVVTLTRPGEALPTPSTLSFPDPTKLQLPHYVVILSTVFVSFFFLLGWCNLACSATNVLLAIFQVVRFYSFFYFFLAAREIFRGSGGVGGDSQHNGFWGDHTPTVFMYFFAAPSALNVLLIAFPVCSAIVGRKTHLIPVRDEIDISLVGSQQQQQQQRQQQEQAMADEGGERKKGRRKIWGGRAPAGEEHPMFGGPWLRPHVPPVSAQAGTGRGERHMRGSERDPYRSSVGAVGGNEYEYARGTPASDPTLRTPNERTGHRGTVVRVSNAAIVLFLAVRNNMAPPRLNELLVSSRDLLRGVRVADVLLMNHWADLKLILITRVFILILRFDWLQVAVYGAHILLHLWLTVDGQVVRLLSLRRAEVRQLYRDAAAAHLADLTRTLKTAATLASKQLRISRVGMGVRGNGGGEATATSAVQTPRMAAQRQQETHAEEPEVVKRGRGSTEGGAVRRRGRNRARRGERSESSEERERRSREENETLCADMCRRSMHQEEMLADPSGVPSSFYGGAVSLLGPQIDSTLAGAGLSGLTNPGGFDPLALRLSGRGLRDRWQTILANQVIPPFS